MKNKFDEMSDEELREFSKKLDVRNNPELYAQKLLQAEILFLAAHGWRALAGLGDLWEDPSASVRCSQDEAVCLQKERNKLKSQ